MEGEGEILLLGATFEEGVSDQTTEVEENKEDDQEASAEEIKANTEVEENKAINQEAEGKKKKKEKNLKRQYNTLKP